MIKDIIEGYKDIFQFLKNPVDRKFRGQINRKRTLSFVLVLILQLFITFFIGVSISIIEEIGIVIPDSTISYELMGQPLWFTFAAFVVIIPFVEELIFRYPLRFRPNFLIRTAIFLISVVTKKSKERIRTQLRYFWDRNFGVLFYSSAIIFGFVHLGNFINFQNTLVFIIPVLILSQLIGGLLIGYLRIRYNLLLGYASHATLNMILIFLPLIVIGRSETGINKKK